MAWLISVVMTVVIVLLLVGGINESIKMNTWANKCVADGGTVQQTKWGLTSEQYECFKNGKIINHVQD